MFLLSKTKCWTYGARLSFEAKSTGKQEGSLNYVGVSDPSKADNVEQVAGAQMEKSINPDVERSTAQTESVDVDVELGVGAQTEEVLYSVDPNTGDDQPGVQNPETDRGFDKTGEEQSLSLNTKDNQGVGYYEDRSVVKKDPAGITSVVDAGERKERLVSEDSIRDNDADVRRTNTERIPNYSWWRWTHLDRERQTFSLHHGAGRDNDTGVVLLSVDGQISDIPVRFLIDSGASECFISQSVVEANGLLVSESPERLKIHLADGFARSSN